MEQKKNEEKIYIAIDSDVLRSLTFVDKLLTKCPRIDIRSATKDITIQRYGEYLKTILQKAKEDKIRFLIVETVFYESCYSPELKGFMKRYCYFPKGIVDLHLDYNKEVERLAVQYTMPYEQRGIMVAAPMKAVYNAAIKKYAPTNDAYIMAEATIENASILTANEKDFVENKRQNVKNHSRVSGITTINVRNGYFQYQDSLSVAPRPFTIPLLGTILTKNPDSLLTTTSPTHTKVSGTEFLRNK